MGVGRTLFWVVQTCVASLLEEGVSVGVSWVGASAPFATPADAHVCSTLISGSTEIFSVTVTADIK